MNCTDSSHLGLCTDTHVHADHVADIKALVSGGVPAALVATHYGLKVQRVRNLTRDVTRLGVMDPEDAAVLIADESGNPYEWRDILTNPAVCRRHLRSALRSTPPESTLYHRLQRAGQALTRVRET